MDFGSPLNQRLCGLLGLSGHHIHGIHGAKVHLVGARPRFMVQTWLYIKGFSPGRTRAQQVTFLNRTPSRRVGLRGGPGRVRDMLRFGQASDGAICIVGSAQSCESQK